MPPELSPSTFTFYGWGEDDEVVIQEFPIFYQGQAGVIRCPEGEVEAPVCSQETKVTTSTWPETTHGEQSSSRIRGLFPQRRSVLEKLA